VGTWEKNSPHTVGSAERHAGELEIRVEIDHLSMNAEREAYAPLVSAIRRSRE
jgi:hypothetical protein